MSLATGNNPVNQYWEVTIEYIMHLDRKSLVKKRFIVLVMAKRPFLYDETGKYRAGKVGSCRPFREPILTQESFLSSWIVAPALINVH